MVKYLELRFSVFLAGCVAVSSVTTAAIIMWWQKPQRRSAAVESATHSTMLWWKDLHRLNSTALQRINHHLMQTLLVNHHHLIYPHQELQVQIQPKTDPEKYLFELIAHECHLKGVMTRENALIIWHIRGLCTIKTACKFHILRCPPHYKQSIYLIKLQKRLILDPTGQGDIT